jgi:hypothetical protein
MRDDETEQEAALRIIQNLVRVVYHLGLHPDDDACIPVFEAEKYLKDREYGDFSP